MLDFSQWIDNINNKMNSGLFFDKLNKISLYSLLFLLPLFFLPFAQSVLAFPKQLLLLFLVFLSLMGWLGKQLVQKKIIIRENKLAYFLLVLIFLSFLFSVIFSLWPTASFWGWPLSIADSFLTLFIFLLLVFVFVNTFQSEREIFSALFFLLISGALAGIFLLLQLYGIFIFPFDFARDFSFNTVGSVYQAVLFLAILLPLSLVFAFRIKKPIFWLILLVLLASIFLTDFRDAWIVLFLGVLTLAIFGLNWSQGKINLGLTVSLMILLIVSLFFILFPVRLPGLPALPFQVSPGTIAEIDILAGVYSEGAKNVFLGTGPGTFIFNYSQYRSPLLNLTLFWGTRFSSGSSEFLDWFITKGVLAGISLLFFIGLMIYLGFKRMISVEKPLGIRLGFLASAVAIIGAGFLSSFSISLWFIFWIIMAGLLFYNSKAKEINLDSHLRRVVFSAIFLVTIIIGVTLFLFQGQNYLAENHYKKAINFSQQGEIDQAIDSVQRAISLNPSVDIYWRDLAQLYLVQANLIAQNRELAAEQKEILVRQAITDGVRSVIRSTEHFPFSASNWNVAGYFYRNLIGVGEAGEKAIESYAKAAELEPASPFPYGEMGKVYILMAQDLKEKQMEDKRKEYLSLAMTNLDKAVDLKLDYFLAHYLKAIVYDQQGRIEEAIAKLEEIKSIFPQDTELSFQLGMLYWREKKLEEAQEAFEMGVELDADYSNARYMLGLVYDEKGEKEKAKEQFERVAQLNPDNQEVIKILENLREGLPALEGIISSELTTEEISITEELSREEMPPEIQW